MTVLVSWFEAKLKSQIWERKLNSNIYNKHENIFFNLALKETENENSIKFSILQRRH